MTPRTRTTRSVVTAFYALATVVVACASRPSPVATLPASPPRPPPVASASSPQREAGAPAPACGGVADCHGERCCVALGGDRFCAASCPGAAVAIACETFADCPPDGQLGMMSEHRRFVVCERGVCDGPRIRDAEPPCAACLDEDCESERAACDADATCRRARLELAACLRKMAGNEAARTGCWDHFQVAGGLRVEASLRTCATIRCVRCEGPEPAARRSP